MARMTHHEIPAGNAGNSWSPLTKQVQETHGRCSDGDHNGTAGGNVVATLTAAGAKVQAVPLVQAAPQAASRQKADTAAAVNALLARNEFALADLKHRLRTGRGGRK